MKRRDLMGMCLQNLSRRKGRTFLTVLGVTIGACAIIIMISIGIGMKESQEKMLAQMGDLTLITVSPAPQNVRSAAPLDRAAVNRILKLTGVILATPKVQADELTFKLIAGRDKRYVNEYATVVGMEPEAPEKLGYRLQEGEGLTLKKGQVLAGANLAYLFRDTKRPEGFNMVDTSALYMEEPGVTPPDPYFNILRTPLQMAVEITVSGKTDQKVYPFQVQAVLVPDYAKGSETVDGLLMHFEDLSKILADARRGAARRKDKGYPTVIVKTQGIGDVARVEEEIKAMGFQTSSMESIRKPMEKEAQQKQMMLGGLGAISLFVAALGITNTMIMSISERTKEIGIMKALGCPIGDIRTLFLLEAGTIGLIGGVVGILISELISFIMNMTQTGGNLLDNAGDLFAAAPEAGSRMSIIPLWLIGFALVFSIFIGLFSGLHPANKAVKIPALEAIKTE